MSKTDKIIELKKLLDSGLISQSDFDRLKKQIFDEPQKDLIDTDDVKISELIENVHEKRNNDSNNSISIKKCNQCGSEIETENSECKVCKTYFIYNENELSNQNKDIYDNTSKNVLIGLFLFILFIILYIIYQKNSSQNNSETGEVKADSTLVDSTNLIAPNETKEEISNSMIWMPQNLNVDRFRNGDLIPHVESEEEWKLAGENNQPAWCYYNNDSANEDKLGKLYNWYAVIDPRGLAPLGWHIPSKDEWKRYIEYIGKEFNTDLREYRNVAGRKMKSKEGWNVDCNGTNESGFSGYPCGLRSHFGSFEYFGHNGFWWSTSEVDNAKAYLFSLYEYENEVIEIDDFKAYGFSVRCIKD